ncbi:MAG: hypothetical protein PHV51_05735, partial [Methanosarcinaceae archaeon]|nr:hypothetical protein [Methanosarcinaceae archaeon]
LIISTLKIKTTLTDVDMQEVVEEPEYNENAYSLLLQISSMQRHRSQVHTVFLHCPGDSRYLHRVKFLN